MKSKLIKKIPTSKLNAKLYANEDQYCSPLDDPNVQAGMPALPPTVVQLLENIEWRRVNMGKFFQDWGDWKFSEMASNIRLDCYYY
jgi:hypothetical protein